jgi:hypothetical protein
MGVTFQMALVVRMSEVDTEEISEHVSPLEWKKHFFFANKSFKIMAS